MTTSLTSRFYAEGFQEGKDEVILETFKSGKMLGIQTGYQRLLLIGMIIGYLKTIAAGGNEKEAFKLYKGRLRLEDIDVDALLSNDDKNIDKLDKLLKKSRNWIQMNSLTKAEQPWKVPKVSVVDELLLKVSGQIPNSSTAQNNDLEDW